MAGFRLAPTVGWAAVLVAALAAGAALPFAARVVVAQVAAPGSGGEPVIHVLASKFEFQPAEIKLKRGQPVVLEMTSLDRAHGFKVPKLGLHADIQADETTRVRVVPEQVGRFPFNCDNFCGDGHEDMDGVIVVTE